MGFVTLTGALVLLGIGSFWAIAKLTRYRVALEDDDAKVAVDQRTNQLIQLAYAVLTVSVLAEFWPGLASWTFDTINAIPLP